MSWADKCLGSLLHSKNYCDILIIDNGSQDGTQEYVREKYHNVMLVENKCNLGFGRANNMGISYALQHHYDGVLLLNQDAWVDEGTINILCTALFPPSILRVTELSQRKAFPPIQRYMIYLKASERKSFLFHLLMPLFGICQSQP